MPHLSDIEKQKREKLKEIESLGIYPFGGRYQTDCSIKELRDNFKEGNSFSIAGRLMAVREHGKAIFYDIEDSTGRIQLYAGKDVLGDDKFSFIKKLDIGDIVGAKGELFKTRTGEETVKLSDITILSKALRPLPEKWHGLKDIETRFRQRYVDLTVNKDVKRIFRVRTAVINKIREILNAKGFLEVETPMMHPIPGGATGNPFKTHHQVLHRDLYLRIAPELYLKELLVGGFEKIYEINRSFRNEGISTRHNPEFTMLEVYRAYSDCEGMMELIEEIIRVVARDVLGKEKIEYQGRTIDLTEWERISFAEVMKNMYDIEPTDDKKILTQKLEKKGVRITENNKEISRTQLLNIIGELVEPKAHDHPVFVVDWFKELCPLAKRKKDNPELTDRFELFVGGLEIANAYSELNDPIEQRKRFEEAGGQIDEDFIRALEYGMPPAGGLGVGIDRLVMLLTDSANIREVIFFPQLKEEK
ncbi:MAG: lysine--tRNA ligase [Omnitrophica bacterium RBG_13_46_9]|nr:MAG: lysine--tRNA ligase [Omnitrophica bacterium RBG_13_46_9]